MTKIFRGCRYEVMVNNDQWSRHSSYDAAHRSFREAVNNKRGDHTVGSHVEFRDVGDGAAPKILKSGVSGW